MVTLMISMNIASNGAGSAPEAMLALKARFSGWHQDPLAALAYHRALWHLRGFDAYQYTLSQRPFSSLEGDLRVRVVAGQVVEVCRLNCATLIQAPETVGTMDDYFEWIERELLSAPHSPRAHFHGLHGYPLSFSLEQISQRQEKERQRA